MKFTSSIIVAAAMFSMTSSAAVSQSVPESEEVIRIAVNEWTGQHVTAHITGALLEKMGYNVEYVAAGTITQFAAMAQGSINLNPEVWDNIVGDVYPKAVEAGDITIIGELGLEGREGWIYPTYMTETCPGLPAVEALIECSQVFATAETFPKGRLIAYPASWGTRSKELVENADLPFVAIGGGSEGAMIAEMQSAYAAKQPILVMFWTPHWIHAEMKFDFIDLPPPTDDCDTNPAVGISETAVSDCGFQQANISKVASGSFAETWPAAYKLVENLTIDNDAQNAMILAVDNQKIPLDDVIASWLEENEATWQSWVDQAQN